MIQIPNDDIPAIGDDEMTVERYALISGMARPSAAGQLVWRRTRKYVEEHMANAGYRVTKRAA